MSTMNVFIVEDENIVAKDIEQSLKKLGYNVVGIASSGEKVKELLEAGVKPDIFLMDLLGFSGLFLLLFLHELEEGPRSGPHLLVFTWKGIKSVFEIISQCHYHG